ncbi:hypothetical protein CR513_25462, partial [Mucuna pruriens]
MEQANEDLEQQNLDLRVEMRQMKEQINKMFELLTQSAALNAAATAQGVTPNATVVIQGTTTYPPRFTQLHHNVYPYGMPFCWNANTGEQPTIERHEQAGENTSGAGVTQGSKVLPPLVYGMGPNVQFTRAPHLVNSSTDSHGLDAVDLYLVPDVVLPVDFKTPKFEKYKGSSCPRVHLVIWTRATLNWYVNLEKGRVKTWRDLAEAFLRQYKYNQDIAPDRSRLQNLSKMEFEGFKDYAQQWRELAAQVQPSLTEKEMVTMFTNALSSPFYDKVVGSVASSFADLVTVGERIESSLKRKKFTQANNSTNFANAVIIDLSNPYGQGKGHGTLQIILSKPRTSAPAAVAAQPKAITMNMLNAQGAQLAQQSGRGRVFTPIPMTYTTLFPLLL